MLHTTGITIMIDTIRTAIISIFQRGWWREMHSRFRVTNSSDRLGLDLGLPQVICSVRLTIHGGFAGASCHLKYESLNNNINPGIQSADCITGEPRRKGIAGEKRTGRVKVGNNSQLYKFTF